MATPYSTGQVYFYVGPAASSPGQAVFLGTVETEPEIQLDRKWSPMFNDIGGRQIPFDLIYDGKQAFVFGDLNRFNYNQLAAIEPSVNGGIRTGFGLPYLDRGVDVDGAVGSLMVTESRHLILYLLFAYGTKLVYLNNMMPQGWRFPFCVLRGPDRYKMGTRDKKVQTIFHAIRGYDPVLRSQTCFDHNVTGLPAPD